MYEGVKNVYLTSMTEVVPKMTESASQAGGSCVPNCEGNALAGGHKQLRAVGWLGKSLLSPAPGDVPPIKPKLAPT